MIYIIKQEEVYQNKVNSSLVSNCNCKMGYSKENGIDYQSSDPGKNVALRNSRHFYTSNKRKKRRSKKVETCAQALHIAHFHTKAKSFPNIVDEGRSRVYRSQEDQ